MLILPIRRYKIWYRSKIHLIKYPYPIQCSELVKKGQFHGYETALGYLYKFINITHPGLRNIKLPVSLNAHTY